MKFSKIGLSYIFGIVTTLGTSATAYAECCGYHGGFSCCGNGPCNIFCCNCDNGCNQGCTTCGPIVWAECATIVARCAAVCVVSDGDACITCMGSSYGTCIDCLPLSAPDAETKTCGRDELFKIIAKGDGKPDGISLTDFEKYVKMKKAASNMDKTTSPVPDMFKAYDLDSNGTIDRREIDNDKVKEGLYK